MKKAGKLMLKIVSIIFMVFGVVAIVLTILELIKSGFSGSALVSSLLSLISGAGMLLVGWFGFKKSDKAGQAKFFIITGAILLVLSLVSTILTFTPVGIIGVILPILFIVGGFMVKK